MQSEDRYMSLLKVVHISRELKLGFQYRKHNTTGSESYRREGRGRVQTEILSATKDQTPRETRQRQPG